MTDALFVWQREPNPSWVEAVNRIAPTNPTIPWLLLYWEPGETWDPIQRWMLRELDPQLQYADPELVAMYEGPSPRTMGHWDGVGAERKWIGESVISLRQWELFQRYKCISRRVWVVQGPDGGHPFALSQAEQAFLRALNLPGADTPPPGALPYAEPDIRTWNRLGEYDRLRKWEHQITWNERRESKTSAGLWVQRDMQEAYHKFGAAMLQFFTEGLKEAIDSVPRGTLEKLYDAAPKKSDDEKPDDYEEIERRFVETAPVRLMS